MDEALPKPWSPFALDMNGDGVFTLGDLRLWLAELYFVPGDWLIWLMSAKLPWAATFLEVGTSDYGGLLSGFLSGCVWFSLLIAAMLVVHFVRAVDDLVTRRCRDGLAYVQRRSRIAGQLLKARLHSVQRTSRPQAIAVATELELEPLELQALAALAEVDAPYALALSDAAHAVGINKRQAQRVLERLTELKLSARATSGSYGEQAYVLTQSGRAFALFQRLSERGP